ncbi:hypothetical protein SALBM135S_08686 [Streptomyces alboniger]
MALPEQGRVLSVTEKRHGALHRKGNRGAPVGSLGVALAGAARRHACAAASSASMRSAARFVPPSAAMETWISASLAPLRGRRPARGPPRAAPGRPPRPTADAGRRRAPAACRRCRTDPWPAVRRPSAWRCEPLLAAARAGVRDEGFGLPRGPATRGTQERTSTFPGTSPSSAASTCLPTWSTTCQPGRSPNASDRLAVEGGLLGEGGPERDEQHLPGTGGPLPVPLRGAVSLTGADEGVHALVDPVGVRLERPGDQYEGARRPADEGIRVLVDPVPGEPGGEALVVGLSPLGRPQFRVHRLGDLLLVPLPGDEVRRERDLGDAPAAGEDARGVRGDVMQYEVGFVPLIGAGQLRQHLDRVGEERLDVVDQLGAPGVRIVVRRGQRRGVGPRFGTGLRDLPGEGVRNGVRVAGARGRRVPA